MKRTTDVVVVGLGAHGSATLYQLAKRGVDVIGIDQFSPPHALGSSHGESRITRLAIGEGEVYTPFALRSHQIWPELEELLSLKQKLYLKTGGLVIGDSGGKGSFMGRRNFIGTTISAARKYSISHRLLSADEMRKEFPLFNVADDEIGYYENDAGILFPERCVLANNNAAEFFGAARIIGCKVIGLRKDRNGVTVLTSEGKISANSCIVSAGAWVSQFLPEKYRKNFQILRQALYWFCPAGDSKGFSIGKFPVYIWERHDIYGFPYISGFVKVAPGGRGTETDLDFVKRTVSWNEPYYMQEVLKQAIPALSGSLADTVTCFYIKTPDGNFVIDWHPEMENVLIFSPCSGHGFKHSAAIGELAAKIITGDSHSYDLSSFALSRFEQNPSRP